MDCVGISMWECRLDDNPVFRTFLVTAAIDADVYQDVLLLVRSGFHQPRKQGFDDAIVTANSFANGFEPDEHGLVLYENRNNSSHCGD